MQIYFYYMNKWHSCHLTSRDAFSWSSCSVSFWGCCLLVCIWGCCHMPLRLVAWFCPAAPLGFFRICLRVSWIISAVRFSTFVRPSWKGGSALVQSKELWIIWTWNMNGEAHLNSITDIIQGRWDCIESLLECRTLCFPISLVRRVLVLVLQ